MKRLLLLRHAKSDWNTPNANDHERPLNARGERSAKRIGRFLDALDLVPDAVVTSSATRARTTVELAAAAGGWGCPIRVSRRLYDSSPETVLEEIRAEDAAAGVVLVAGHEPVWSELASRLIDGGHLRMPTAALAGIDFEVERWSDVRFGRGQLVFLMPSRLLGKAGAAKE